MFNKEMQVEMAKKVGKEYEFFDVSGLEKCECGGKPVMYAEHYLNKNLSFEHMTIRCEKCRNFCSGVYDIVGKADDFYKEKDVLEKELKDKWNNREYKKISEKELEKKREILRRKNK